MNRIQDSDGQFPKNIDIIYCLPAAIIGTHLGYFASQTQSILPIEQFMLQRQQPNNNSCPGETRRTLFNL
jgi:hypothetical protein